MSKPIDQERADFEVFAVKVNESIGEDDDAGCSELRLDRQGGCYVCPETYAAWLAWKTRASVQPAGVAVAEGLLLAKETVVQLPDGSKELGYTPMPGLGIFANSEEVFGVIRELGLPLGWVSVRIDQVIAMSAPCKQ